ncbi:hypothetical protein [Sphingomonas lenta]|uniref:Uncharacterized protein n=1 Tax=Sphingomonas lenta TaxID=1141887 RepID=A0A2A2SEW2_9SPHN|nr:hypothetical protein [Sphingomonas lenta]PAX07740.1 hypothetical protein CKY28_08875 [Sphingomonas lenta]
MASHTLPGFQHRTRLERPLERRLFVLAAIPLPPSSTLRWPPRRPFPYHLAFCVFAEFVDAGDVFYETLAAGWRMRTRRR